MQQIRFTNCGMRAVGYTNHIHENTIISMETQSYPWKDKGRNVITVSVTRSNVKLICETSVFRRSVFEAFALLGCFAAYVGSYLPTRRDTLSTPYSRIKYSSYAPWSLNIGPIGCPETSVNKCQHAIRNIPEDRRRSYIDIHKLK